MGKSKGRAAGAEVPSVSMEEVARLLAQPSKVPMVAATRARRQPRLKRSDASAVAASEGEAPSAEELADYDPSMFQWEGHEGAVFFLVYESQRACRLALARLSVFLEDREMHGQVLHQPATIQEYAAASYTGHNFTPEDVARFFEAAEAAEIPLHPAEQRLQALLVQTGLVPANEQAASGYPNYSCFHHARRDAGILGLVKTGDSTQNAETLLHESMHGLFYSYSVLRDATHEYWTTCLTAEERGIFETYLSDLGYDATNGFLVVNEFLAYMTTERSLFGKPRHDKAVASTRRGSGKPSGNENLQLLQRVQSDFNTRIRASVPDPRPGLGCLKCIFDD